jgi:hypothetical protein
MVAVNDTFFFFYYYYYISFYLFLRACFAITALEMISSQAVFRVTYVFTLGGQNRFLFIYS